MFGFLFSLLILDGVLLMVVVLLQAGKGGGLAAMGGAGTGTESLIGGRHAATLLTKTTWVTGGIFLVLSLVLSIMSSRSRQPSSILRQEFQQSAPATPQPVLPGVEQGQPPTEGGGAAQPGVAPPEGQSGAPAGGGESGTPPAANPGTPPSGSGQNPATPPPGG